MTHENTNGEMEERKGKRENSSLGERKKERKRMMMMKTRHDRTTEGRRETKRIEKREVLFTKLRGGLSPPGSCCFAGLPLTARRQLSPNVNRMSRQRPNRNFESMTKEVGYDRE